jgi:4'-phosphopantetheinyl transferase
MACASCLSWRDPAGEERVASLRDDECQVWWAGISLADHRLLAYLDERELERLTRFRHGDDRARYLVAHALARVVLSAHLALPPAEIPITAGVCRRSGEPHGKPCLLGEHGIELSISHSGQVVGIAVARAAPVGLDVEDLRHRAGERLPDRVLSPAERSVFEAFSGAERHAALLCWFTRKEALLKATGDGLAVSMRELTFTAPEQRPQLLTWLARPEIARLAHLYAVRPSPAHVGSLAVIGADLVVCERRGDRLLQRAARSTR